MPHVTSARAEIQIIGPDAIYAPLILTPVVAGSAHDFSIREYRTRKRDSRFTLENLPLALAIPGNALKDTIFWTYEVYGDPEEDLRESLEITLTLPDNSDSVTLELRAVEHEELPELLFYEYRDDGGDWRPMEDVMFIEVLTDSFIHSMEAMVLDALQSTDLEILPDLLDAAD